MADDVANAALGPPAEHGGAAARGDLGQTEALADQIRTIKDEVDSLPVSFLRLAKPWYHDIVVIVAVLSFIFSFGTTVFSYYETQQEEVRDRRNELRLLIQRLGALPKENAELIQRFPDDPLTVGGLSGMINQENVLLAKQAAAAVNELEGRSPISSIEYLAVANALVASGLAEPAAALVLILLCHKIST